ncbi:MAG: CPBP family intramembrane metalloprotease [Alphaproteobacteria bacterium]|nr:CPBP family intramembrane metalloprotease [Alphaproteobacteria bacterium]
MAVGRRHLEFLLLCIVFPSIIIFGQYGFFMFYFLWAATVYCLAVFYFSDREFLHHMWRFDQLTWENMKPILVRWILASIAMVIFIYFYNRAEMFSIILNRPQVIPFILILYPILSAIPQEFIFCTFFFKRFHSIFPTERAKIIASSVVFAYAHILYLNPVSPVLSIFAGLIFAQTYSKSRSLALVSVEHALYGATLFLSGLGTYFYSGNVPPP